MPVQGDTLRFVLLELPGVAAVRRAEVTPVGGGISGRLHRLAERRDRLARLFQSLASLLETVLQQALHVLGIVAVERLPGVVLDGPLQRSEQVLVVDDVAVLLVLAVEAIHPTDRLEEPVVLHVLVDVEAGCGRSVEAGQELVDNDEELHPARFVYETLLHLLLERLDLLHRRIFGLVEMRSEHLAVGAVLEEPLGESFSGLLSLDVRRCRPIRGDDRALARQTGLLKQVEEAAGRVDAVGDEQRVAASALQPVACLHVEENVGDDLRKPAACAPHLAHRAPALLELRARDIGQALRLGLEPLIDLRRRGDVLVDVSGPS